MIGRVNEITTTRMGNHFCKRLIHMGNGKRLTYSFRRVQYGSMFVRSVFETTECRRHLNLAVEFSSTDTMQKFNFYAASGKSKREPNLQLPLSELGMFWLNKK